MMTTHKSQKILKVVGVVLVLLILGTYTYTRTRDVFLGPGITVTTPTSGSTVTQQLLVVEGTSLRTNAFTINDAPVLIEESGHFATALLLAPGYNILKLAAIDRFGRTHQEYIELVYLEK